MVSALKAVALRVRGWAVAVVVVALSAGLVATATPASAAPVAKANGCFRKVNQSGESSPLPPLDNGQWSVEMALDVDMVSATCPNCHIILVEANTSSTGDLLDGINAAVALGAKFVSLSFTDPEAKSDQSFESDLIHPGVVITAGSGDYGYGAGPQYPASSPNVVSVGGTFLTPASNARGWNESAWSDFLFGAGSGCSKFEPQPATQVGLTPCSTRAVSDVSAVASNLAIYDSFGQSGWIVVGGTSAATPLIASVYALAGARAATDNGTTAPYVNKSQLNDVTTGGTGSCGGATICTAGVGWDGPTGLGTPNGIGAFRVGTGPLPPANTVTVTSPGAQSAVVGAAVSLPIHATDSAASTLSYKAFGLPDGLWINATTGVISGTPTVVGSSSVTVTATDTTWAAGSATFTWTVAAPPPHVVSVTNPGAQSTSVNSAVSLPIGATDSVASTLSYRATGLPTGLSINAATGLISGTPTVVGLSSVTVTATDTTGVSGSVSFTWAVLTLTHVVTVTNPGNRSSVVGTAVSFQVKATDTVPSTLTYQAVGLSAGLSINSATGLITGVPTVAGAPSVTVTATDPTGAAGSAKFAWIVTGSTVHVVTVTNPGTQSSVVNTAVSVQVKATDSVASTLSYKAAGLPAGLSINASNGLISGTPTTTGSYSTTVTATDTTGAVGSATFVWTVTAAKHVVTMTNPGNHSTAVNTAASLQLKATDSVTSTLTYTATGLPNGLSINSSTGLITGTPTAAGSFAPVVSVSDPSGATAAVSFAWTVTPKQTGRMVVVTNPGNPSSVQGSQVALQLNATDTVASTLTYQAAGLPTGLSVNASTGLILGTPTVAGSYGITVTVTDTAGVTGSASFTWTITSSGSTTKVTFTNPGNQSIAAGTAVTLPLKVSSTAAFQLFKFSATGLPAGLTINATTGVITGTPTTAATSTVTVTAVDYTGTPASVTFTWTVK